MCEYGNLSDFLSDHAAMIEHRYLGVSPYDDIEPEIRLLLDIMSAVRTLPGLDSPPDAPDTFNAQVEDAIAAYRAERK